MYHPCFLEEQAVLTPKEFELAAIDMAGFLTLQLRKKLEGRCSPQGFIKENSLKLLSRTCGMAKSGTFTSDFTFRCKIQCDVLYPAVGDIVETEVLKVNKMGAYSAFENSLRVLMPRDLHQGSTNFDELKVGAALRISGPLGTAYLRQKHTGPMLCAGGGTGEGCADAEKGSECAPRLARDEKEVRSR